jgi:hypothetical protein
LEDLPGLKICSVRDGFADKDKGGALNGWHWSN